MISLSWGPHSQLGSPPHAWTTQAVAFAVVMLTMGSNVLRNYRELLTLLKRLPESSYVSESQRAKQEILQHRNEADVLKVSDLHKRLVAKISFLRMTTTRRPGESQRHKSGIFVLREGALVESEAEQQSRCIVQLTCMSYRHIGHTNS